MALVLLFLFVFVPGKCIAGGAPAAFQVDWERLGQLSERVCRPAPVVGSVREVAAELSARLRDPASPLRAVSEELLELLGEGMARGPSPEDILRAHLGPFVSFAQRSLAQRIPVRATPGERPCGQEVRCAQEVRYLAVRELVDHGRLALLDALWEIEDWRVLRFVATAPLSLWEGAGEWEYPLRLRWEPGAGSQCPEWRTEGGLLYLGWEAALWTEMLDRARAEGRQRARWALALLAEVKLSAATLHWASPLVLQSFALHLGVPHAGGRESAGEPVTLPGWGTLDDARKEALLRAFQEQAGHFRWAAYRTSLLQHVFGSRQPDESEVFLLVGATRGLGT